MVKIYIEKILNFSIINYIIDELFRYIDIDFTITKNYEDADIIYSDISCCTKNKIKIIPSMLLWKNYKKLESLPPFPLSKKDNTTYVYCDDIVASTFFMLSGYEEYLNPKRDKFDRFLYEYSYYKEDKIYIEPIVEQYREILIEQLNTIGIQCSRKNIWEDKEFGLFLTHDVDGVYKYRNTLKSIAKIILKPCKFSFNELLESKKDINKDPYVKGFEYLINQSTKYNFKSTFFFITKIREKLDNFYDIEDKLIKKIIKKIKVNNFEIGIHGTLSSYNNTLYMKEEFDVLNNAIGMRQHYLKYDIKRTSAIQESSFKYDSTLCFADMIGFRRGTCLPFKLYDIENNKTLDIYELPLIVMEQTLKEYIKLTPKEAYVKVLDIINMIKQYNGLFTLLWHPGNCCDEWNKWLEDFYEKVLVFLNKNNVESLTGCEIYKRIKID